MLNGERENKPVNEILQLERNGIGEQPTHERRKKGRKEESR